jgi:hypothetical protein
MAAPRPAPTRLGQVSLPWLALGAALVASFALPWTGAGPGSTLSGFSTVGLVASGAVATWVPPWVAVPLAALPACGVLLAVAGLAEGPAVRRARLAVLAVSTALVLALAGATWVLPVLTPGPGSWLAVVAVVAGHLFIVLGRLPRGPVGSRRGGTT